MRRWIWLALAFLSCGCGQDADRLSKACHLTVTKLEVMTHGARAKLSNGIQAARGETGVASRVATRLRWDKSMEGAEIQVHLVDGVIELDGTVESTDQEQRAVDVANATTGVDKVESNLQVK